MTFRTSLSQFHRGIFGLATEIENRILLRAEVMSDKKNYGQAQRMSQRTRGQSRKINSVWSMGQMSQYNCIRRTCVCVCDVAWDRFHYPTDIKCWWKLYLCCRRNKTPTKKHTYHPNIIYLPRLVCTFYICWWAAVSLLSSLSHCGQ